MIRRATSDDADARLVRRASRRVGVTIAVAVSVLVVAVLVATLQIVLAQIPAGRLLSTSPHETSVDIDGLGILLWGIGIGLVAVLLAGTLALLVTRRAVSPLVEALRRQRQFVADASHELRTPLAILDARIQELQRSMPKDDPLRPLVAEVRDDSRGVIGVVADLLDAVEVAPTGPREPADAVASVRSAVSSVRIVARERGVEVTLGAPEEELLVDLPEASLQRCVVALVDNAVKHSPEGATVAVLVSTRRNEVLIEVADHGHGIRGIAPERVFDRFAQSSDDDVEGSVRSGFGIGLALVQDTAGRYGGGVSVASTSREGTRMLLRFPRARQRRSLH